MGLPQGAAHRWEGMPRQPQPRRRPKCLQARSARCAPTLSWPPWTDRETLSGGRGRAMRATMRAAPVAAAQGRGEKPAQAAATSSLRRLLRCRVRHRCLPSLVRRMGCRAAQGLGTPSRGVRCLLPTTRAGQARQQLGVGCLRERWLMPRARAAAALASRVSYLLPPSTRLAAGFSLAALAPLPPLAHSLHTYSHVPIAFARSHHSAPASGRDGWVVPRCEGVEKTCSSSCLGSCHRADSRCCFRPFAVAAASFCGGGRRRRWTVVH